MRKCKVKYKMRKCKECSECCNAVQVDFSTYTKFAGERCSYLLNDGCSLYNKKDTL